MGPYAPEMKRVFGPRNGYWLQIPEALAVIAYILIQIHYKAEALSALRAFKSRFKVGAKIYICYVVDITRLASSCRLGLIYMVGSHSMLN